MQNCEQGKFRNIDFGFGDRVTLLPSLQYFEKTIFAFAKAAIFMRSRTMEEDPIGLE